MATSEEITVWKNPEKNDKKQDSGGRLERPHSKRTISGPAPIQGGIRRSYLELRVTDIRMRNNLKMGPCPGLCVRESNKKNRALDRW